MECSKLPNVATRAHISSLHCQFVVHITRSLLHVMSSAIGFDVDDCVFADFGVAQY